MGLVRTVEPVLEPVTLMEAKRHARVIHTEEDVDIEGYITSARFYCEVFTNRAFITQTFALTLPGFPHHIVCPNPPLQSVDSITYVDTDGATQTLAASVYVVETTTEPGRIFLKHNQSWPSTRADIAAVTVTFVAGYGTVRGDVPASIRQAVKMLAAHSIELREPVVVGTTVSEVPYGVGPLLWSNRVMEVA